MYLPEAGHSHMNAGKCESMPVCKVEYQEATPDVSVGGIIAPSLRGVSDPTTVAAS